MTEEETLECTDLVALRTECYRLRGIITRNKSVFNKANEGTRIIVDENKTLKIQLAEARRGQTADKTQDLMNTLFGQFQK